ncbi:polysaccharide deacetylase family protein [Gulosibacter chungangensis]|uniref:Polysaccharide deacetylase family protein n=1 Tax=Gulosibacter chungangensis TaxID=979746 RepID=A0A7J5BAF5_9MICO|nr:polysaccharide deacetylase family protein [Gulosibacter chungangensis]KAB1641215.1 polysaccharide deacetylase family protein [Gulosibacter chungangensis]
MSPVSLRRIRTALATLAATAIALTGCAAPLPTDASWQPREPESISGLAFSGESVAFDSLDPANLAGISQHRATNTDLGLDLSWPMVAGADEFNSEIQEQQWSLIEAQEVATGLNYAPQLQPHGLSERGCAPGQTTASADELREQYPDASLIGSCEIVAAAGNILGVRTRVLDDEQDASVTTYYDLASGNSTAATELLSLDEEALGTLWHEAVVAIRANAGQVTLWPGDDATPLDETSRAQFETALAGAVLEADGSLVLDKSGGFESEVLDALPGRDAPGLVDRIQFTPEAIEPYLSEQGRSTLEQLDANWQPPQTSTMGLHAGCDLVPCVALTYDDGPNPGMTELLDTFAERGDVATFFFIGNQVSGNADIVQRTYDEGHELANHSWDHPDFTTLKPNELRDQISKTQNAIASITGDAPTLVRPPYGAFNNKVVADIGMPIIMWDLDTLDWQGPPRESLISDVVDNSRPGSIVLMHSIHDNTVAAAPGIIDGLHDRGFELVTVTGLFDGSVPGGVTFSRE